MTFESSVPEVRLNNDVRIPQLGFGVFKVPEPETAAAVTTALESGYRSIDTAAVYGNETAVGAALAKSDVPRDEIFVTTKLWNDSQGYDAALAGFDESLARLGLDYVDLYLIHWPAPAKDLYLDTWRAFEKLYADERVRAIGVSNFQPAHLRRLLEHTGVVPVLNQIELHPYLQQEELRALHAEHGIATEAWSPIARGGALLQDPVITSIAARHGRTPAQVVLRWHIQVGNIVIPKSVTPSRVQENIDIFDFSLTAEDLSAVTTLDNGTRTGPNPDTFN
ncbi:aldo/keto reductase [Sphaerisporangium siamense]|uniref:Diketogulonate reductase-like aldo/keto reductase n=1 Tax=Sphaerisporangium siamense TaxID=795645 RepID=A0A7W7DGS1_9ACTN|nr:aldo/keto reductase [Sphaerisporangium siamense]MBB4705063.1 diketogulonate reductase-like aldo/keto reductase [Sphaerisporangium siamense]